MCKAFLLPQVLALSVGSRNCFHSSPFQLLVAHSLQIYLQGKSQYSQVANAVDCHMTTIYEKLTAPDDFNYVSLFESRKKRCRSVLKCGLASPSWNFIHNVVDPSHVARDCEQIWKQLMFKATLEMQIIKLMLRLTLRIS
jgi:hypothetical protein